MGRYAARLQRLLGMPEDGGGIAFGSFRPADISAVVMELVPRRLQELDVLSRDPALSAQAQAFIAHHKFHTYEDFCLEKKQRQPGKRIISATALPWSGGKPISRRTSSIFASGTGISGNFWSGRSRRASRERPSTLLSMLPGRRIPARVISPKRSPSSSPGKPTPGCGS